MACRTEMNERPLPENGLVLLNACYWVLLSIAQKSDALSASYRCETRLQGRKLICLDSEGTGGHMFKTLLGIVAIAAGFAAMPAAQAQTIDNGVTQVKLRGGTGPMGQLAVGDFQISNLDGFKGAHRVAISVFNVAFPNENHFSARLDKRAGNGRLQAKATMQTTMTGIDQATKQHIADTAYTAFVAELVRAGFEVVGPEELAKLAPEWAAWTSEPNFTIGRFGTYVAPKGYQVRFLQGDKSRRDASSSAFGDTTAFRLLDRPQAWSRGAYVAHDAGVGTIGVTMVVDYGVYSRSASVREGAETGFMPGVTIQSGTINDTATIIEYWGTKLGFSAVAALAVPIISPDASFAQLSGGGGDISLVANPAIFQKDADDVTRNAAAKLVGAMLLTKP